MNKITVGFFLAKSKTTIKGLLVLFALLFMNAQLSWGQTAVSYTALTTISCPATPVATISAAPSGLTFSQISRGSGVTCGTAGGAISGSSFNGTLATNISASKWYTFSITSDASTAFILNSLSIVSRVSSATGSPNVSVQYSIGGSSPTTVIGSYTPTSSAATYNITPGSTISVGASQVLNIYIIPNSLTAAGTTCRVENNTSATVTTYAIGGGPEINIKGNAVSIVDGATPASTTNGTDFGTVATSTNVTKTYTIENTGSADLVLTAPYVQKSLATTVFSITQPALTTIPAGGSTTFSVDFNSASAGTFDEGIEVLSNDTDEGTYNFAIKAIAEVPVPNIVVKGNSTIILVGDATPSTTDSTDFGSTASNTNVVKTYTIENTGTGSLTVNGILMSNSPTSKYSIGGISFPATIAAIGSTTFTVTFNSAVAGTFTDTVLIDNNDPTDSTYDFAVTAKAAVLNFGVGDISITALANDTTDGISFVNWVPIPVDAELIFTDNAWDGSALLTTENSMVWKNNTGSIIPVGTVIYINAVTPSTDLGYVTGALSGLSASGENLFIYEGSAVSPNFIYGLSNFPWITTGVVTTNNSYLPTVLNVTNGNIVTGNLDNVEYSGALAPKDEKSSFSAYKTLVNDPANWTKNDLYFALNSIDFELAAVWEAAAWTDGLTPTASLKTVIKDSYGTIANGAFAAKKLTVTSLGSLTINSATNVTVQNEVINSGSLIVENNANLIQVNAVSNSGAITVNRNSNPLFRSDYTLWSSPVSDGTQTLAGFSSLTSQSPISRFYVYDNTQGATGLYSSVSPTTPFATGTGYLIRMPNEDPSNLGTSSPYYLGTSTLTYNAVFTGVPNNGDVTLTVTSGTYNAVGNPYPSTINADLFLSDNSITSGTDALYFWRKSNNSTTSSYATYTTAGGTANLGDPLSITPDATIQVGQGFIAKSTSATLKFTNSMRTANNGNKILRTKLIERNRIWLNLSSETTPISQMMVAYMTGATQGIDPTIDGSYINDSKTALNSLISNEEYVIQGRSLPFDGADVVPLAFKTAAAGKFTIAIDHTDGLFATGQDIYLVDSAIGSETDLKAGSYTFSAAAGVDNARFSLKYQKTLKVDAQVFNDNSVTVYRNNGTLYVNSGAIAIANIKVFDIQGRLITELKGVKLNAATISNLKATNQVLIVQVTSDDNTVVNKKIVN